MNQLPRGARVYLRKPQLKDGEEFLMLMQKSEFFLHPWVQPPRTPELFRHYIKRISRPNQDGLFICDKNNHQIAGVININEIVRGLFQSAFLGYYIGVPFSGRGLMQEGLNLALDYIFTTIKLHRVEANIQPENMKSINLVKRCGFNREGYSPRYLKIDGQWRDHERWALLVEDWRKWGQTN